MVTLNYFSDLLCVWAYTAQARLDELEAQLGEQVQIRYHYINLFGDTEARIGQGWKDKGGFDGFAAHTREVVSQFPEFQLSAETWAKTRPRSSMLPHLYLKSVTLAHGDAASSQLAKRLRQAFFAEGLDIGVASVVEAEIQALGLAIEPVRQKLADGQAQAALWQDQLLREQYQLQGSPSYVLNQGRQKLFGNVGYRILEANVQELLSQPTSGASWC